MFSTPFKDPTSHADLVQEDEVIEAFCGWLKVWDLYFSRASVRLASQLRGVDPSETYVAPEYTRTIHNGAPLRRCLLLHGAVGTGKTTLTNFILTRLNYTIHRFDGPSYTTGELGRVLETQKSILSFQLARPSSETTPTPKRTAILFDNIDALPAAHIKEVVAQITRQDKAIIAGKSGVPVILITSDPFLWPLRPLRSLSFLLDIRPPSKGKLVERLMTLYPTAGIRSTTVFNWAVEAIPHDIRQLLLAFFFTQGMDLTQKTLLPVMFGTTAASDLALARAVATQNYSYLVADFDSATEQLLSDFLASHSTKPLANRFGVTVLLHLTKVLGFSRETYEEACHRLLEHITGISITNRMRLDRISHTNGIYPAFVSALSLITSDTLHPWLVTPWLAALIELSAALVESPPPPRTHKAIYSTLAYPTGTRLRNLHQLSQKLFNRYYTGISRVGAGTIGCRPSLYAAEILPYTSICVGCGLPDICNLSLLPREIQLLTVQLAILDQDTGILAYLRDLPEGDEPQETDGLWRHIHRRIPTGSFRLIESIQEQLPPFPGHYSALMSDMDAFVDGLRAEAERLELGPDASPDKVAALTYLYQDGVTTAVRRPVTFSSLWSGGRSE
ncbi:putative AAA family protein [Giardia muris]|uniref:Putative AAA family protein n=1 Tax=Giardia muris TaxID=5742 RepID=A0A4Z1SRD9_GIAMU|nr:putative AAA family protein [Giardia muris]|eukprot:TNJ27535.1 putative AAA family protein [Giardia muris]